LIGAKSIGLVLILMPGSRLVVLKSLRFAACLIVRAREAIAALLQHLNQDLRHIESSHHHAVGRIAFGEIPREELVERLHAGVILPLRIERVH